MPERFLTTAEQIEASPLPRSIDFYARQIVAGFITGAHRSPYHGFSVEFAEHRKYNDGESVRHLDWKLFARTDKLYVKRYEAETNLRCQLVLDTSGSMLYPADRTVHKAAYAALCAAALARLLRRQNDAVGLTLYSGQIDAHLPSKLSDSHLRLLNAELDTVLRLRHDPAAPRPSSTAHTLHRLAEMMPKRSLLTLFTDLPEADHNLYGALEHLRYNMHEVIVFHLRHDATERLFDLPSRPCKLVNMETGQVVRLNPAEYRDFYLKAAQARLAELRRRCLQYKVDLVEADIDRPFAEVLAPWLARRAQLG